MDTIKALKSALTDRLSHGTWKEIQASHEMVRLEWRPELGPGSGKRCYVEQVLSGLGDDEIGGLAQRCIETFEDEALIELQNALWWHEADGRPRLSEVTRLAVADGLDGRFIHPREDPNEFLSRFTGGAVDPFRLPIVRYGQDGRLHFAWRAPSDLFNLGTGQQLQFKPFSHRA